MIGLNNSVIAKEELNQKTPNQPLIVQTLDGKSYITLYIWRCSQGLWQPNPIIVNESKIKAACKVEIFSYDLIAGAMTGLNIPVESFRFGGCWIYSVDVYVTTYRVSEPLPGDHINSPEVMWWVSPTSERPSHLKDGVMYPDPKGDLA